MTQVDKGADSEADLSIATDKVCFIIVKAREFDAKDVVTEPDPASNPSDDAMVSVLEDHEDDPVLSELLSRIMRDESRHFSFYYRQAERRLARPGAARVARFLVDHFWDPVGSGVQPAEETRFLIGYLLSDPAGRAAARRIDTTIRSLPGFDRVRLLEAWVDRVTVLAR